MAPHVINLIVKTDWDIGKMTQVQIIRFFKAIDKKVGSVPRGIQNTTTPRTVSTNELYTHANNFYNGDNLASMGYTGEKFEGETLLNYYDLVKNIPVVKFCTVCTSEENGK